MQQYNSYHVDGKRNKFCHGAKNNTFATMEGNKTRNGYATLLLYM